jgi:hypothetical protein
MQQLNISGRDLPNFKRLDATDGTIFGRYNKVNSVNPYRCRFVAFYPDGSIIFGKNLFETGWDNIPNGLCELRYELSTGHVIQIPKYKAYLPMIEVSVGVEGSRIFHCINVNCLAENEIVLYKVVLRQDSISPCRIGDIVMSKTNIPEKFGIGWKFTSYGANV